MVLTRHRSRDRGAAAVEMALILPVLLLLIGGIIDFGRLFMVQGMMTNAAREGTRAAFIEPNPSAAQATIELRAVNAGRSAKAVAASSTDPTATMSSCSGSPAQRSVTTTIQFRWLMLNALPGVTNPQTMSSTSTIGC